MFEIKPYKNTTNNVTKKTFSRLKNSVHIEPIWFKTIYLCLAALTKLNGIAHDYRKFQMRWSLSPTNGTIFLIAFRKNGKKLTTKQTKFR